MPYGTFIRCLVSRRRIPADALLSSLTLPGRRAPTDLQLRFAPNFRKAVRSIAAHAPASVDPKTRNGALLTDDISLDESLTDILPHGMVRLGVHRDAILIEQALVAFNGNNAAASVLETKSTNPKRRRGMCIGDMQ